MNTRNLIHRTVHLAFLSVSAVAALMGSGGADAISPRFSYDKTVDILYGRGLINHGSTIKDLTLDVYDPVGTTSTNRPAVVIVHGGAYTGGDSETLAGAAKYLAQRGFVCFAINYRLLPENPPRGLTDCVADARTAIRWVRAHAAQYRVHPDAIAVFGHSAGAYTTVELAITDPTAYVSDLPDEPINNAAVSPMAQAAVEFSGGYFSAGAFDAADTPLMIVHGDNDPVVPYANALAIRDAYQASGAAYEFYGIPGWGHGFDPAYTLIDGKVLYDIMIEFMLNKGLGDLTDIDGDGIADRIEMFTDIDSDGIPSIYDLDSDGDSLTDKYEGSADSDGDGIIDAFDTDSDGDGLPDRDEDYDGDGITNICELNGDVDGDGIPNFLDTDSDGDGILDSHEGTMDVDIDGRPNYFDDDSDGDCMGDRWEGEGDADSDGIPDFLDSDGDGDGVEDLYQDADGDGWANFLERSPDSDADGVPDFLDLDSDGDGLPDALESRRDTDGDGLIGRLDKDSDNDGLEDGLEGTDDPDHDSLGNCLDTDSDGDGISDTVEGSNDSDYDGIPDRLDLDSDGDGLTDGEEGAADPDKDGIPNFLDLDSDADGIPDAEEGGDDFDDDGLYDAVDTDSDNDGLPDSIEGDGDPDGDGIPNFRDTNSDGDDLSDHLEMALGTNAVAAADPPSVPAGRLTAYLLLLGLAGFCSLKRRSARKADQNR